MWKDTVQYCIIPNIGLPNQGWSERSTTFGWPETTHCNRSGSYSKPENPSLGWSDICTGHTCWKTSSTNTWQSQQRTNNNCGLPSVGTLFYTSYGVLTLSLEFFLGYRQLKMPIVFWWSSLDALLSQEHTRALSAPRVHTLWWWRAVIPTT